MTNKDLVELNIDSLDRQIFEQLQSQTVRAVILALGSNYQAEHYLSYVREKLATLGCNQFSTAYQNSDFTAKPDQPKPDYTNQCVYLALSESMTLAQLQRIFKQFERECDRQHQAERTAVKRVTMDIDTLLVELSDAERWIVMADRYPFKAHEMAGMGELAIKGFK